MTKADIVETIYERVGFSKKESAELVETVFDVIKDALVNGEKVKFSGFGNFIVREKNARKGRNPQTGEEIQLEARRVLTFKPSLVLKNALNEGQEQEVDDDEDDEDDSSETRARNRRSRARGGEQTMIEAVQAQMAKIPDRTYFRIGEVAKLIGVEPYVLRFWETEFKAMAPPKSRSKQRMYRRRDLETILTIKHLLYAERFTIEGARKRMLELQREARRGEAAAPPREGLAKLRDDLLALASWSPSAHCASGPIIAARRRASAAWIGSTAGRAALRSRLASRALPPCALRVVFLVARFGVFFFMPAVY